MLDAIAEIDAKQEVPARDKLYMVASFIIDSYRYDPDLMKVIIVEVTRAANSFGRALPRRFARHTTGSRRSSRTRAWTARSSRRSARWAAMCFYGAIEQLLSGWIFDVLPKGDDEFESARELVVERSCGGLEIESAPISG